MFGGFSPVIATVLRKVTGQPFAVAYYLMAAATISLVSLFVLNDRMGEELSS